MARITTVFLLLFVTAALTTAGVINIPGDYAAIQAGIDAAENGDTVLVAEGTYLENIKFKGKAITVASLYLIDADTSHISKTVIDGSQPSHPDSGSVVSFVNGEDSTSVVTGFTISGGTGTIVTNTFDDQEPEQFRAGGGILCYNAGALIFSNIIEENHLSQYRVAAGGGIAAYPIGSSAFVIIEHNQILNNSLTAEESAFGGGIDLTFDARVQDNLIAYNVAGPTEPGGPPNCWGGGLECWTDHNHSLKVLINRNRIRYNSVYGSERARGGGINLELGDFILTNNIIDHNTAGGGGGLFVHQSNALMMHNTVVMNKAFFGGSTGGGISMSLNTLSSAAIINSIIWGNQAQDNPQLKSSLYATVAYTDIEGEIWEGLGNISKDPAFADTLTFQLAEASPCIARGAGAVSIDDIIYTAPETDFAGNLRPDPSGSHPDMGALESPSGIPGDYLRVPDHYGTIQAAIDQADSGDVVLVSEGTYLENIRFKGKAITVASLYLLDADTSHISRTVIDGSQPSHPDSGSTVSFVNGEDSTSVLTGFTISGGTGTIVTYTYDDNEDDARVGGGILCYDAGARIISNIIKENQLSQHRATVGGGIAAFPIGSSAYVIIEHNQILNNSLTAEESVGGGGIDLTFNARVQDNLIAYNIAGPAEPGGPKGSWGGGLECWTDHNHSLKVLINRNRIRYNLGYGSERANGGGINLELGEFVITNNIIDHNTAGGGGGIYVYQSNILIMHNTVVMNKALFGGSNGGGIYLNFNTLSSATILNSIIWGNQAQRNPQLNGSIYNTNVAYTDIEGDSLQVIWTTNADPLFADTVDFYLLDNSPCISWAPENIEIDGEIYHVPPTDIYGTARPSLENTTPDMGAVESLAGWDNPAVSIEKQDNMLPTVFALDQNYPNPFNPLTTISYRLPFSSDVTLDIYNILGQKTVTLVSERQAAGNYQVTWDARGFASGVYYYRLSTDKGFVQTKKLILLK